MCLAIQNHFLSTSGHPMSAASHPLWRQGALEHKVVASQINAKIRNIAQAIRIF
jgi:hypothetical protein